MKSFITTFVFICLMALPGLVTAQEEPHWDYEEGEHGPTHWSTLSENFALCGAGHAQSPIDITYAETLNLSDITFAYGTTPLTVFNAGHTVEVNVEAGSYITYNARDYQLRQFHFHHPSEHTVNGEAAVMEMHLVHRASNEDLAVIGVLLLLSEEDNAVLAPIFANMPADANTLTTTDMTLTIDDLLPELRTFLTYGGSLTTPPCSEGVRWLLMTEPMPVSEAQVEAFAALFEQNARPTQPTNGRDILVDVE